MIPRALVGPVMAMGRPRRPVAESLAVREAAALIAEELSSASPPAVAAHLAQRVVAAMLADIDRDPDDYISAALSALAQQILPEPIATLATCPDIDTASEFVERRVSRLRSRCGRYLSPTQQCADREAIITDLVELLSGRYLRHLRGRR